MNRIAIHSVPRSGSTWVGSIFDSHPAVIYRMQPLFSYAFKDYLNDNSSNQTINEFFKKIANSNDSFITQLEEKKKGSIPVFEKADKATHVCYKEVRYHHILPNLLEKDNQIKVIGIIRNPFSVINSWLRAPKEFKKDLGWKVENEWRFAPSKNLNKAEEFNGYEKWKEVVLLFLKLQKQFPEQFYLLEYERLLDNTQLYTKDLFDFCNLSIEAQTLQFLKQSTESNNSDPYSVFKKKEKDDSWKKELPTYIINKIKNDLEFKQLNANFKWI
ncbi:sulfotransferase domain-containing protein [Salinimicrobium catena]|uniref:sulfotransferase domain-containing protein n=1 Tax=Salinimicrobium catena TaxID=390640 RepID=UPI002FE47D39